jgi:molecular chaperone GrpE
MVKKEQNIAENVSLNETAGSEATAEEKKTVENNVVSPEERLAQLEQELQSTIQAKDEYYNRLLRNQADFDNFRRRTRAEMEQLTLSAGEDLVKKILPALDSLERAVLCFNEQQDNCSWREGVELTLKQFRNILMTEGLEAVVALEQEFDPQVHEAVMQEESSTVSTPTVVQELQRGYKFRGKLLRPALVKVAVPAK